MIFKKIQQLEVKNEELENKLKMEREEAKKALKVSRL